jgi:hypothetical protein
MYRTSVGRKRDGAEKEGDKRKKREKEEMPDPL